MNNKEFWTDVMRSGAIIGLIMAASRIFERYVLFYSNMNLATTSTLLIGEMLIACIIFIWLLVSVGIQYCYFKCLDMNFCISLQRPHSAECRGLLLAADQYNKLID